MKTDDWARCYDYSEYDQYTECMTQEHDIGTEQSDLIDKQIRTDALLLRQLQQEERSHVLNQNYQVEHDDPSKKSSSMMKSFIWSLHISYR